MFDSDFFSTFKKADATQLVFNLIQNEMDFQDKKWGAQKHADCTWLAILTEEVGEVAKECLENGFDNKPKKDMLKELVQVAAVSVQWAIQLNKELEKCPTNPVNSKRHS
jgi:NTP pyrophosphatase (non-canonical NTP hydrolase)